MTWVGWALTALITVHAGAGGRRRPGRDTRSGVRLGGGSATIGGLGYVRLKRVTPAWPALPFDEVWSPPLVLGLAAWTRQSVGVTRPTLDRGLVAARRPRG